jgi:hypothetical protein
LLRVEFHPDSPGIRTYHLGSNRPEEYWRKEKQKTYSISFFSHWWMYISPFYALTSKVLISNKTQQNWWAFQFFETEKLWHFFERGTAIKLRRMTTRCRLYVAESSIFEKFLNFVKWPPGVA